MSIVFYAAPMSSATPIQHALRELDVPHELVMLDLSKKEQRKPGFLALNPNGRVPTLVVDGTPMFEALAILQWLGDTYGVDRKFWPALGTPDRLQALSWTTWAYVTYGTVLQRFNYAGSPMVPEALHHSGQRKRAGEEFQDLLHILEQRLDRNGYAIGDSFSLVDLALASVVTYSTICGVSVEGHANIQTWLARFHERPLYKETWETPVAP